MGWATGGGYIGYQAAAYLLFGNIASGLILSELAPDSHWEYVSGTQRRRVNGELTSWRPIVPGIRNKYKIVKWVESREACGQQCELDANRCILDALRKRNAWNVRR